MTVTVMVWKTNAFGSLRVNVLGHSTTGELAYVKFTRDDKFRPATLPAEMWVRTETLHKARQPRATEVASTIKNRNVKALVEVTKEETPKPRTRTKSLKPTAPAFSDAQTF